MGDERDGQATRLGPWATRAWVCVTGVASRAPNI